MYKIVLTIICCLLFITSAPNADSKSQTFFMSAIPDTLTTFFTETNPPYIPDFKTALLLLEIDKKGRLKKIKVENKADSLLVPYLSPYLSSLTYSPGTFNNKKSKSILPVQVDIKRKNATPEFTFPVSRQAQYDIGSLYFKALTYNKIEPPKIVTFPSYFSENNPTDSSLEYPYVIYHVALDEKGRVTETETIAVSGKVFSGQLQSAILYSEFSPLKIKGKPKKSQINLKISLFPQISYPTLVFDSLTVDTLPVLERYRVEVLPPTATFLAPPLPRRYAAEEHPSTFLKTPFSGKQRAFIRIDTSGAVTLLQAASKQKEMINNFRLLIKKLRFYPALDLDGRKKDYYGYLEISPKDRLTIRISYLWLD